MLHAPALQDPEGVSWVDKRAVDAGPPVPESDMGYVLHLSREQVDECPQFLVPFNV